MSYSPVQVNDEAGNPLGKVKEGDTKLQVLERISRKGGLFDRNDVGLLNSDTVSTKEGPYVLKISDFAVDQTPFWDLSNDFSDLLKREHALPPPDEPQEWIGRDVSRELIHRVAWENFSHRTASDHACFAFLVASGHVRSGKTRSGYETPRIVEQVCKESRKTYDGITFSKRQYLRIDFLNGSKFNNQFDGPGLTASEALGARLMNAFYQTTILKRVRHDEALLHIINCVRSKNSAEVVPIVVHFDEHGEFIRERNEAFKDKSGKDYFLSMLALIGSAATSAETALSDLHRAGHYFIVPITTGTSHSAANFVGVSRYGVEKVPLPLLTLPDMKRMARACLVLQNITEEDSGEFDAILGSPLFEIALGDTGGLPGLIYFACDKGASKNHISYVQNLHDRTFAYVRPEWGDRWNATTSVFLARPRVADDFVIQKSRKTDPEERYTMKQALDSGTVFYRVEGELGLAPTLLAKYNSTSPVLNPIIVKTISTAEEWTWEDFEKAHLLYLAATLGALIKEQERFEEKTLSTFLRNVCPSDSPALVQDLSLQYEENQFKKATYIQESNQCIPKSSAKPSKRILVDTEDISNVHLAAPGTPIVDGYLNLKLNNLDGSTTLFVQYKHSGLRSASSPVTVHHMNEEVGKLRGRLQKHHWPNDRPFLFLWVTNRVVTNVEGATPDRCLLWVDKNSLGEHAPLLGHRGLVPAEILRKDEDV